MRPEGIHRTGQRAFRVLAAMLVPWVLGCVPYTPKPLDPAATQARLERRSLSDPQLVAWVDAHAGGAAHSWDLDRLTWAALYDNADVRVARAHWETARAEAITAGALPNPQLDTSFEYNRDAPQGTSPWTRGLSLGIPIETGGKRAARIAVAVADAEQARLEYADAAWHQRQQVRAALAGLLVPADALREQEAAQAERVRLMQRRVELGLAARPDFTQARLTLQTIAGQAADARREASESRAALAAALGVPVDALAGVDIALAAVDTPVPLDRLPARDAQRQALLHRPDVLAALASYQAAEAALRLEIAKQYPDVTISPGLLWEAGEAKWTLGLSLVLPLLNRNQGPIADALAKRKEAAAQVLQAQAGALAELEQARAGYAAALDALQQAEGQVRSAGQLVAVAQRSLAAGQGIRSDVLGAQVELASAQARRARALMQAEDRLGALEDAMRTPVAGAPFAPVDAINASNEEAVQ
ncbi:MAG: TolC family protein [Lysobacter sp.]|nr:TolC family protein [Lysobacter sp.]